MLNDKTENDESTQQYWPEDGQYILDCILDFILDIVLDFTVINSEPKTYGAFTVECLQKDDEIELVSRTLKLTNYYRYYKPEVINIKPEVVYIKPEVIKILKL